MEKLRISENGRYFETESGKPFVWLADTDWTMPQRLKWDDADYLMMKRKSQGFTVLQIVALDPEADAEMRNPAGEKALVDNDLSHPNERYFEYLDWLIDRAESYGMYVLLLPVWGQLVVGHDWMGNTYEKTVTEENAYGYGCFIGNRYKDKNHILWCLGGDRQPVHLGVDYKNVWRRLAEGLAKGLTGEDLHYNEKSPVWKQLMITYHACHEAETGECSTMSYWTEDDAWISYIMLQSGHGTAPRNYELVEKEYMNHTMPVWDGEPAYEMMPTSWPVCEEFHGSWMVRRRAYWSLLAGAFGFTYGHACVWNSTSEKERNHIGRQTWYEALQSEGSAHMKLLRSFMERMEIMKAVPAQELIVDNTQETGGHIQACKSVEQQYICAYLPAGGSITLLLNSEWEDASLWWWNPSDGEFYNNLSIQSNVPAKIQLDGYYRLSAKSPTEGERRDWILILTKSGEVPIHQEAYYIFEEATEEKKVFEW